MDSFSLLPPELFDGGLIIDATLGGGGHCELILETHSRLRAIGLDQDPHAREAASVRLERFGSRVRILGENFADFNPPEKAIYVLADLGVSSPQLETAERGFSFRIDGPLDMRMNNEKGMTAKELIETCKEDELAQIIYEYGEERFSRRIARKIKKDLLEKGAYKGTKELAYAIAGCYPAKQRFSRIHPATRTFQALRIAVNNELTVLEEFLKKAPDWLKKDGLISLISFHSLEDRRVKNTFLHDQRLEKVNRKPLIANEKELNHNPRSRSAKLRIGRKVND